jgi:hypothetical protein
VRSGSVRDARGEAGARAYSPALPYVVTIERNARASTDTLIAGRWRPESRGAA